MKKANTKKFFCVYFINIYNIGKTLNLEPFFAKTLEISTILAVQDLKRP
jgi:hypothetical protein